MVNLVNGLGGAAGFGESQLSRNDDSYQSYIDITPVFGSAGLNFFGTNYTSISVNNNGNITFGGSGMSTYTPYGMQSSSRAMIAPFFADVDTRGGAVSATPGGTSKGTNLTYYDFNSAGNGTLTVTWDDVGYYSSKTDKLNAFQLQLVGRGNGNFDVIFRYESINWTTGSASGGTGGLGGTVARAGYSTGNGSSWYELSQSGNQSSILALESTLGNTGVAGYYKFSITSGTSGNDNLRGTSGNDSLDGSSGNDTIYGLAGNDVLHGGAGADKLYGDLGDDTYMIDAQDTVVELAGQGIDTVQAGFSHTLAANVENLVLTGTSNINGTGNSANNTIIGNSGNNIFNGAGGFDFVSFQLTRYGITADLSNTASQYTSQGYDTFTSIEGLIGTEAADRLTGNAVANTLIGAAGNDTLSGGAGNDILDGGADVDTMIGGLGDDVFYVDNVGDRVSEATSAGTDTVYSYLGAHTLAANVENGRILSAGSANLTGNSLNNVLYAGAGNNVLNGGTGSDTASYVYAASAVTANLGVTTAQATGGSGSDTLTAIENLTGSNYNDRLTGNSAANVLNGGAGADTLVGGLGNDTYYVDHASDVVSETSSTGGIDTIIASITRTLGNYQENLTLSGTAAINATGNSLANTLTGNGAANVLNGGAGNDTLSGGAGNDRLVGGVGKDVLTGGTGNDIFDFNALNETGLTSTTWDVITDFIRGQDKIDLSTLDANTATAANDAFRTVIAGTAAFTAAGQLKVSGGVLYGNTDADSTAEFAIQLTGISSLSTADFIL